jgi:ribonucleoside-diphosphate reductase alpha chain
MTIRKRSGLEAAFQPEKIRKAILSAFASIGGMSANSRDSEDSGNNAPTDANPRDDDRPGEIADAIVDSIGHEAEIRFSAGNPLSVEEIQDLVEQGLIGFQQHKAVRSFILYRTRHAEYREQLAGFAARLPDAASPLGLKCLSVIRRVQREYDNAFYPVDLLLRRFESFLKPGMSETDTVKALTRAALELTSKESPRWEYAASAFLNIQLREEMDREMTRLDIHDFFGKIRSLTQENLYGTYMLEHYTQSDIRELETAMSDSRDDLLTYSSLDLLIKRYLIHDGNDRVLETPQEMFMGIAMHLAMPEGENRVAWAKRFYDVLSLLKATMATPTLSNARKPYHQLSSCFIDTVPDALDGIYRSITNFAQVSKFGGGMGLYFGKVRAVGSDIRGFKGAAGGVMRWIRLANDTAVAVDQLGVRQGAVAVYLDAWHRDLPEFLQMKTNNGDERLKAHDVFPAVCYPDLFWKLARDDMDAVWHLMCPHEILKARGYSLEDSFGEEWERRYLECAGDPAISKRDITVRDLVRLIIKSVVETGTPFAFNRDTVNRFNPNPHRGMIYASNLCTEIAQNMSPVESISQETMDVDGDTVVVTRTKAGDFVVCNLASLVLGNLGREPGSDLEAELETVIPTVVRALDNVMELNYYPVPYAGITNHRYRPIGLGTSGYHHLLAKRGIRWESPEHLAFADHLYERINRAVIRASCALAAEKGPYPLFEGSDWQTGAYFDKRGYDSPEWEAVRRDVAEKGLRNGYLMAIAPTGSTSIIAGTTAAVDPILNRYFLEEKKGMIVPRVAPDLAPATFWFYKNAHAMDQDWVVDAAAIRQKHIDQAQSVNLFITPEFTMRQVLALYIRAWEKGVKTIYYVRSQSLEVEDCDVCTA